MQRRLGFTLVEMMIALGVSAIALSAAVVAANAQQRAFYNSQKIRTAQNAGRSALLFIEQRLPRAGYGMDASLALDFGWYDRDICPEEECPPDRTDGADELVFYARDPAYFVPTDPAGEPRGHAWHLVAIDESEVKVKARAKDVFRKGQILQAVCPGEPRYAYFTVGATVRTDVDEPDFAVTLLEEDTTNPFRRQDVAVGVPCFLAGGRVFAIDRNRLHVRPVDMGDGRFDPYLVLDTGTDLDGDLDVDADDEILVAEGIEAFQVSYHFTNRPTGPALQAGTSAAITLNTGNPTEVDDVVSVTPFPGTVATGQFEYEPSSFYRHRLFTPLPAERLTNHQANVRAVHVSLVARSPEPDPASSANLTWAAGSPLFRLNQATAPDWAPTDGGYQRTVLDTTVNLPNMTVRAMSYF